MDGMYMSKFIITKELNVHVKIYNNKGAEMIDASITKEIWVQNPLYYQPPKITKAGENQKNPSIQEPK